MKKLGYILIIFLFINTNSCFFVETCDGTRYQIRKKIDLGDGSCQYRAEAIGKCLIWNDQNYVEFIDSCDRYLLSEIHDKDKLQ